jgi:phage tail tape-measure protein
VGWYDGSLLGSQLGCCEGSQVGCHVGSLLGSHVGCSEGSQVGNAVGSYVGSQVGWEVLGENVGRSVGSLDGRSVGSCVGVAVGRSLGSLVGEWVGLKVGSKLGSLLGNELGECVGCSVGTPWSVGATVWLISSVGAEVVGACVGFFVGFCVGSSVGYSVGECVGWAVGASLTNDGGSGARTPSCCNKFIGALEEEVKNPVPVCVKAATVTAATTSTESKIVPALRHTLFGAESASFLTSAKTWSASKSSSRAGRDSYRPDMTDDSRDK